ncbi:methyltransferase domain-containing protein [Nonomuraea sp. NPDC050404]|uniref:methyltransferase domain-containing protein n=1 Tax=Nonomuraea sp. NPDC050404 TaxID=3155783 RepID=UPI0033CC83FB
MTGSAAGTEALIDEISAIVPCKAPVRAAMRAVPREEFVPARGLAVFEDGGPRLIDREQARADWLSTVYSDTSIVTQLDDGATELSKGVGDYTSSASAPSTVASLLHRLDVEAGHHVLEVGTGTGWTAALLSHLVGQHGMVTSIEVDQAVAAQASKNLAAVGVQANLVTGDGAEGYPQAVPYDRVQATCGIRNVPYPWIEQARPGAVIVMPYCPGFGDGHELRLVVTSDGVAHGRFPGYASYMLMRAQRPLTDEAARSPDEKHWKTTRVDPRTVAFASPGAHLVITALTGLTSAEAADRDEDGELHRLWLSDPAVPHSWGTVQWRPGADEYEVYQVGDRPLWDEVTEAYFRWVAWGEPGRSRFGMTVTREGQRIWLDTPDNLI